MPRTLRFHRGSYIGPERGAPHILDKALEIWLLGFFGIVIFFSNRVKPQVEKNNQAQIKNDHAKSVEH